MNKLNRQISQSAIPNVNTAVSSRQASTLYTTNVAPTISRTTRVRFSSNKSVSNGITMKKE